MGPTRKVGCKRRRRSSRQRVGKTLKCWHAKKKAGRQAYNKYSQAHGVAVVARVCVCANIHPYVHTYVNTQPYVQTCNGFAA